MGAAQGRGRRQVYACCCIPQRLQCRDGQLFPGEPLGSPPPPPPPPPLHPLTPPAAYLYSPSTQAKQERPNCEMTKRLADAAICGSQKGREGSGRRERSREVGGVRPGGRAAGAQQGGLAGCARVGTPSRPRPLSSWCAPAHHLVPYCPPCDTARTLWHCAACYCLSCGNIHFVVPLLLWYCLICGTARLFPPPGTAPVCHPGTPPAGPPGIAPSSARRG